MSVFGFFFFLAGEKKTFLTRLVDRQHLVEVQPRARVEHEDLLDAGHDVAHTLVADVERSRDDLVVLSRDW